jgi:hypothetical protein
MFETSVMRYTKTHDNGHDFAGRHSTITLIFLGAVLEQIFLLLGNK